MNKQKTLRGWTINSGDYKRESSGEPNFKKIRNKGKNFKRFWAVFLILLLMAIELFVLKYAANI